MDTMCGGLKEGSYSQRSPRTIWIWAHNRRSDRPPEARGARTLNSNNQAGSEDIFAAYIREQRSSTEVGGSIAQWWRPRKGLSHELLVRIHSKGTLGAVDL